MARVARARSRYWSQSGTVKDFYKGAQTGSFTYAPTKLCTCADSKGRPVADSNFDSTQYSGEGLGLSGMLYKGATPYASYMKTYANYPVGVVFPIAKSTPLPAHSGWMLDLVAGTNPSRPTFTPPTMIQDLVQLPGLLRETGKLIRTPRSAMSAKQLANYYLAAQFGWAPLIEDVQKLLALQHHVIKTSQMLQKLYAKGGLRRRLKFKDDTSQEVGTTNISTFVGGGSLYADWSMTIKRRTWGTIHWYPTTLPPYHHDDLRLNRLATRIVLGLTVEGMAKGLWDVLPWTWLLGWFTNVGKYLYSYSNTVPAQHGAGCFMSEVDIQVACTPRWDSQLSGKIVPSGTFRRTRKTRIVSSWVTPGLNVPFIDTFRLSILSALFVQRMNR